MLDTACGRKRNRQKAGLRAEEGAERGEGVPLRSGSKLPGRRRHAEGPRQPPNGERPRAAECPPGRAVGRLCPARGCCGGPTWEAPWKPLQRS